MPVRFRRSIGNKYFRVHLNKGGPSVSMGVPGARVSFGRTGQRISVGIPGSGLSYSQKISGSRQRQPEIQPDSQGEENPPEPQSALPQPERSTSKLVVAGAFTAVLAVVFVVSAIRAPTAGMIAAAVVSAVAAGIAIWRGAPQQREFNQAYEVEQAAYDAAVAAERQAEAAARQAEIERQQAIEQAYEQGLVDIHRLDIVALAERVADIMGAYCDGPRPEITYSAGEVGAFQLQFDDSLAAVVVKRSFKPVGVDAVRKLHELVSRAGCDDGFLVTNASEYTSAAASEASAKKITLVSGPQIVRMAAKRGIDWENIRHGL